MSSFNNSKEIISNGNVYNLSAFRNRRYINELAKDNAESQRQKDMDDLTKLLQPSFMQEIDWQTHNDNEKLKDLILDNNQIWLKREIALRKLIDLGADQMIREIVYDIDSLNLSESEISDFDRKQYRQISRQRRSLSNLLLKNLPQIIQVFDATAPDLKYIFINNTHDGFASLDYDNNQQNEIIGLLSPQIACQMSYDTWTTIFNDYNEEAALRLQSIAQDILEYDRLRHYLSSQTLSYLNSKLVLLK